MVDDGERRSCRQEVFGRINVVLKWLRNKLRRWLGIEKKQERIDSIDCLFAGKVIGRAAILDACGMKLLVSDGRDSYLIGPEHVVSKDQFWVAWSQRTKDEFVWEDGSLFKPEKQA